KSCESRFKQCTVTVGQQFFLLCKHNNCFCLNCGQQYLFMDNNSTETFTGYDFSASENQLMVEKMAKDFAEKHIRPHVMEWDEAQHFPVELFKKLGELGMMSVFVPEQYG